MCRPFGGFVDYKSRLSTLKVLRDAFCSQVLEEMSGEERTSVLRFVWARPRPRKTYP
jgi:hypothetical protein